MKRWLPRLLLVLALAWYVALVVRFPTHGALGNDPTTYVQMARDLVERGTPTLESSLFNKLAGENSSWDALLPPGYHVVPATGVIAPNYAFGFPLLLAAAYLVVGESALVWLTPLLGGLSLVATYALGVLLFSGLSQWRRETISGLAVLLLATTPKQIQLALVPMSDVPTQLFCVLAIVCGLMALRAAGRRTWVWIGLCGASLGMAYLIRHSALVMFLPLAPIVWRWGSTRRQRITQIAFALVVLVLVMSSDIVYRATTLGSLFEVESVESAELAFSDLPQTLAGMLGALFSVTGFGPALLLASVGAWAVWRRKHELALTVLALWILAFVLFHAPLQLTGVFENSLRYLVPAYPAIALLISAGVIEVVARAVHVLFLKERTQTDWLDKVAWGAGAFVCLVLLAVALRSAVGPERFVARAYGWMSATTRQDLETLPLRLPPNAVIGSSDQLAGAVRLYVGRDVFRPGNMVEPSQEFPRFTGRMEAEGQAVYLLGGWDCAADADASQRLPAWLAEYATELQSGEVRDLPYSCPTRLYFIP